MNKGSILSRQRAAGVTYAAMIIIFLIVSLCGQLVLKATNAGDFARYVVSGLFSFVALGISAIFFSRVSNVGFKPCHGLCAFSPLFIVLAVMLAASMIMGLGFINTLFANWLSAAGINVGVSADIPLNNFSDYFIFSIVLALLPAISEEVFFRGIIFGGVREAGFLRAALVCSLSFSLYHCSLTQLIYQFIYGFMLCALTERSNSVIPAAIAHFLNNFVVLTLGYLKISVDLFNPFIIAGGAIMLASTALILFCPLCKGLNGGVKCRDFAKSPKPCKGVVIREFMLCGGLMGIFICAAVIILGAIGV